MGKADMNGKKYVTIVIRADDERAARSLIPGEIIRGNVIVSCSLGDVLTLNDKLMELIPSDKETELSEVERENLSAFI